MTARRPATRADGWPLRALDYRWRWWWYFSERPYARAYRRRAIAGREMRRKDKRR